MNPKAVDPDACVDNPDHPDKCRLEVGSFPEPVEERLRKFLQAEHECGGGPFEVSTRYVHYSNLFGKGNCLWYQAFVLEAGEYDNEVLQLGYVRKEGGDWWEMFT